MVVLHGLAVLGREAVGDLVIVVHDAAALGDVGGEVDEPLHGIDVGVSQVGHILDEVKAGLKGLILLLTLLGITIKN